jgi:hypothetical protein
MSQIFAATPETIYNVLANDTTFSSLLGTYTFRGGSTSDSIAILTPGQQLPLLESQVGLECIIHDSGDVSRKDYINDTSNFNTVWKLFLIVWDPATGSDLDAAVKRIMHLFHGSTSIETLATAQGLRARVQTMVMIPEESGLHKDGVNPPILLCFPAFRQFTHGQLLCSLWLRCLYSPAAF